MHQRHTLGKLDSTTSSEEKTVTVQAIICTGKDMPRQESMPVLGLRGAFLMNTWNNSAKKLEEEDFPHTLTRV